MQVLGLQQCKERMAAVIDVGAAPGSWTSFLATTSECVRSIDCLMVRAEGPLARDFEHT